MKLKGESVIQLLSPYGNWKHKNGMQVVDRDAGRKIRNSFMQSFDRIWGLPIYIGHPDEGHKKHMAKAVGRVESIAQTPDGIAITANYEDDVFKKISNGKLKWLSPRWRMEKLKDGTYRPVRLISVGITNNPNIPGSGTILESPTKTATRLNGKALAANEGCKKLAEKIRACSQLGGRLNAESERLKRESIDKKIASLSEKPAPHELAKMALERADERGESYLESFSALRRKYYGKTKFGAQ